MPADASFKLERKKVGAGTTKAANSKPKSFFAAESTANSAGGSGKFHTHRGIKSTGGGAHSGGSNGNSAYNSGDGSSGAVASNGAKIPIVNEINQATASLEMQKL